MNNKTSIPIGRMTIVAGEDLQPYRFINYAGRHCSTSDKVLGVSLNATSEGKLATICFSGIAVVQAKTTIANAGVEVKPTDDGEATITINAFQNIYALDVANANGYIRVKL